MTRPEWEVLCLVAIMWTAGFLVGLGLGLWVTR